MEQQQIPLKPIQELLFLAFDHTNPSSFILIHITIAIKAFHKQKKVPPS
jgi:hypothetical protein